MVTSIWIGILAGFAATMVLSAFMLMKQFMGFMPQMDMIGMISRMLNSSRSIGWMIHFMVGGLLYGGVFGWVLGPADWGGAYWIKGLILGAAGWVLAMTMMMPMAGNGFFGVKLGGMVPVMSLLMHLMFGAVLGLSYGLMIT